MIRRAWRLACLLAAMSIVATPAFATWAYVQSNTNLASPAGCASSGSSCTVATLSNVTTGNNLIAFGTWSGTTSAASFSGCGGTWTADKTVNDATNGQSATVGHATSISTGACTITVTFPTTCASGQCGVMVAEYSGLTATPPDVFPGQRSACSATANSCTSGAGTTTAANDLIVGVMFCDSGTAGSFSIGTSPLAFSAARQSVSSTVGIGAFMLEDVNQPSAASTAATAAGPGASTSALAFMLSFKQAGAGAAAPCMRSLLGVGCDAS